MDFACFGYPKSPSRCKFLDGYLKTLFNMIANYSWPKHYFFFLKLEYKNNKKVMKYYEIL